MKLTAITRNRTTRGVLILLKGSFILMDLFGGKILLATVNEEKTEEAGLSLPMDI